MTALLESLALMVTLDVVSWLIPTSLLFSWVRKPVLLTCLMGRAPGSSILVIEQDYGPQSAAWLFASSPPILAVFERSSIWYQQPACPSTAHVISSPISLSFLRLNHLGWYASLAIPTLIDTSLQLPVITSLQLVSYCPSTWSFYSTCLPNCSTLFSPSTWLDSPSIPFQTHFPRYCQDPSLALPYQTQVRVSLHHIVPLDGVSCPQMDGFTLGRFTKHI